jgi:hypothetical protein
MRLQLVNCSSAEYCARAIDLCIDACALPSSFQRHPVSIRGAVNA